MNLRTRLSLNPSEPSGHKFVPHAVYCQKVRRIRRIALQLLPQLMDMGIHSSGSWIALASPHFVEKLISRNNTELILNHKLQRLEFLRRKQNLLAATGHIHCCKVHSDIVKNVW